MREALDQWDYVIAAYVIGVLGTLLLTGWAYLSMRHAEARRDRSREL
jgi:hypothetical protein